MFGGEYLDRKLPRDELFFKVKQEMEAKEEERKNKFKNKKVHERFLPDVPGTQKEETAKIK